MKAEASRIPTLEPKKRQAKTPTNQACSKAAVYARVENHQDTLPKTNSSHLKIDLWKRVFFYWQPPISGGMLVSVSVNIPNCYTNMFWIHLLPKSLVPLMYFQHRDLQNVKHLLVPLMSSLKMKFQSCKFSKISIYIYHLDILSLYILQNICKYTIYIIYNIYP